jgi:hypothetical protein
MMTVVSGTSATAWNARMPNNAQMDAVLAELRKAWIKQPSWRLGELICNAINPPESSHWVFDIEDGELQKRLARVAEAPEEPFGQESHGRR